ncbi:MAG TPA: arsenate reductase ArsC, partial [Thermosulfidibacter takaii]|nr:arsenate reductase ArsC [Thermosulfidibacter takaii]
EEPKKTVLFLCWGNACRSIMAEALTKHYWGDRVEALSSGISPLGYIPQETLMVLEEVGVSTQGLRSKRMKGLDLESVDLVVNLSGTSLEGRLPPELAGKRVIDWYIRDPYGENLDSFRRTRDAIEWLITEKLPKWLEEV